MVKSTSRKGVLKAKGSTKAKRTSRWEEFLSFCNAHADSSWWFRGVSDNKYRLIPKVGRDAENVDWQQPTESGRTTTFAVLEMRVFNAFKRRSVLSLPVRPESPFEWLALAQHHGVPTRLLDWTPNPLMAAWFATRKTDAPDDQVAKVIAVKATAKWREHEEDIDPFDKRRKEPVFVVSPHWHPRVRAQRGCFSIHPTPNQPWSLNGLTHNEFEIDHSEWRAFQRRLFYFGVDASTTMADLAGLGDALAWQLRSRVGVGEAGY
jgi:hypothetical protein